jgi:hypothetical protein
VWNEKIRLDGLELLVECSVELFFGKPEVASEEARAAPRNVDGSNFRAFDGKRLASVKDEKCRGTDDLVFRHIGLAAGEQEGLREET